MDTSVGGPLTENAKSLLRTQMKTSVHTVHITDQANDQESHSISTTSTWKFFTFLIYIKCCMEMSLGFYVRVCYKKNINMTK